MRLKENGSLNAHRTHDIRQTAAGWIKRIEDLDNPTMLFVMADSLSRGGLVVKDDKEEVQVDLGDSQLAAMALVKYCDITKLGAVALMEKVKDTAENGAEDLLGLKLVAIDVALDRGRLIDIQDLFLYLNANRDFLPVELLKIKLKEIRNAMDGLAETQQMRIQTSVSGVINNDK